MLPEQPAAAVSNSTSHSEPVHITLARFLSTSPAAIAAATTLNHGAEIAITFSESAGEYRVFWVDGVTHLEAGTALDPDFALYLTTAAVRSICSRIDADIGDLGIVFFEHIVSRYAEEKIRVTAHSGVIKLARRGWLSLLARGGPKLVGWLAKKGLRGPGAVSHALTRFKRK